MKRVRLLAAHIDTPTGRMLCVTGDYGRLKALEWDDHADRLHRFLRLYQGTGVELAEVPKTPDAVVVNLASVAGIVGSRFVGQSQSAKIKAAQTQLQNFKLALGRYEIDMGRYPTSSESLRVLVEKPGGQNAKAWQGPYLDGDAVPKDQWENAWNYRQPGQHNPEGYDLWSNGPDGAEGGSDDISNWTK